MDKVRLGRVLGTGARQAARTLWNAAEAVAAPDPNPQTSQRPEAPAGRPAAHRVAEATARAVPSAKQIAHTKTHAQKAGRSMLSPLAKFSSVLWLEVTGAFFAIFAVFSGAAAWKLRGVVLAPGTGTAAETVHRFYIYLIVFAVFAYFTVSSFAKARRRQRR